MSFLPDATLVPRLVTEVPSHENGMLATDNTSVTYSLREGVTWSDGEPFTADDIRFTWEWITNPDNAATTFDLYKVIDDVEVVDDLTAKLVFAEPQPAWYVPFSGSWWGPVLPKHVLEGGGQQGYQDFLLNPSAPARTSSSRSHRRSGHLRRQRAVPRPEQAVLLDGRAQGRRRCGLAARAVLEPASTTTPGTSRSSRRYFSRWPPAALAR